MNKLYKILNNKGVIELSKYIKNKYNCDLFDELQYTIMTKGVLATMDLIRNRLCMKNDLVVWLCQREIAFKRVDELYDEYINDCYNKISKEKFKKLLCDRRDMKLSRKIDKNNKRYYVFVPTWYDTKSKNKVRTFVKK